jgi:hypothetical protein
VQLSKPCFKFIRDIFCSFRVDTFDKKLLSNEGLKVAFVTLVWTLLTKKLTSNGGLKVAFKRTYRLRREKAGLVVRTHTVIHSTFIFKDRKNVFSQKLSTQGQYFFNPVVFRVQARTPLGA